MITRSTSKDYVEGGIISTMDCKKLWTKKRKNYEVISEVLTISVLLSEDKLNKLKNLLMEKKKNNLTSNEVLEE